MDMDVIDLVSAGRRKVGDWFGPGLWHGGVDWNHSGGPTPPTSCSLQQSNTNAIDKLFSFCASTALKGNVAVYKG